MMKLSIHMIVIDELELNFFFDKDNKPTIDMNGNRYTSLAQLFQACPSLSNAAHQDKIAQVANFLLKGLEFYYIENIEAFKEDYQQRIETEQTNLDYPYPRLSDYGVYNLSTMHRPIVENGSLVFFVKHDYTHLPYKVTLPFPLVSEQSKAKYELLPYA